MEPLLVSVLCKQKFKFHLKLLCKMEIHSNFRIFTFPYSKMNRDGLGYVCCMYVDCMLDLT